MQTNRNTPGIATSFRSNKLSLDLDFLTDSENSHSRGKKKQCFSSSFQNKKLSIDLGDSEDSHSRGKKKHTFSSSFQNKKLSIDIGELAHGNNSVLSQKASAKKGWIGGMISKLKGGKTSPNTHQLPDDNAKRSPKIQQQPEETAKKSPTWRPEKQSRAASPIAVSPTAARDANGMILSDVKQLRIKALQQDLLVLVKDAEKGGRIKVMKRKETECISMPGHGASALQTVRRTNRS